MNVPLIRPEFLLTHEAGVRYVLRRAYAAWPEPDRSRLVYANVPRVQAFYTQGKVFWEAARKTKELSVRYLLCYTAAHNWGKVRILFADPHYPRRRSDLTHGLSLRSGRREAGELGGEVYVEPHGLFPLLAGEERSTLVGKRVTVRALFRAAFAHGFLHLPEEGDSPVREEEVCARDEDTLLRSLRADLLHLMATFVLANFARYEADRFFRLLDGSYDFFPLALEAYAELCTSHLPDLVFSREISSGLLPRELPAEVLYERT
ncbi:YaaC family protein [Brockia lithotrophica]|nr:YaaC family protein [Brockia lithotrophica]